MSLIKSNPISAPMIKKPSSSILIDLVTSSDDEADFEPRTPPIRARRPLPLNRTQEIIDLVSDDDVDDNGDDNEKEEIVPITSITDWYPLHSRPEPMPVSDTSLLRTLLDKPVNEFSQDLSWVDRAEANPAPMVINNTTPIIPDLPEHLVDSGAVIEPPMDDTLVMVVVPMNNEAAKVIRTTDETVQPDKPRGMPFDTDTKRKKRQPDPRAKNATLSPRKSERQHK